MLRGIEQREADSQASSCSNRERSTLSHKLPTTTPALILHNAVSGIIIIIMELRERENYSTEQILIVSHDPILTCVYICQAAESQIAGLAHAVVKAAAGDCKFTKIRF